MRQLLALPVGVLMVGNWWYLYGWEFMDEINHALFGVVLALLFGRYALVALVVLGTGWEIYELARYPISAFTPGPAAYWDDTLLDLALPALVIIATRRYDLDNLPILRTILYKG